MDLYANELEEQILNKVSEKNMTFIEAVVEFCEEKDVAYENLKGMLTKPIKDRLEQEYKNLNYLPKDEYEDLY